MNGKSVHSMSKVVPFERYEAEMDKATSWDCQTLQRLISAFLASVAVVVLCVTLLSISLGLLRNGDVRSHERFTIFRFTDVSWRSQSRTAKTRTESDCAWLFTATYNFSCTLLDDSCLCSSRPGTQFPNPDFDLDQTSVPSLVMSTHMLCKMHQTRGRYMLTIS